jgi:ribosomal protein S1
VLRLDNDNQRIALGVKQLTADPWPTIDKYYQIGTLVTGTVATVRNFGAFIGLDHGFSGLLPTSDPAETQLVKIEAALVIGQEISVRIVAINKEQRQIALSMKAAVKLS